MSETSSRPPAIDVADLPTTVFGHRSPMWWGTIGFMIIEGSTLLICAVAYFYLRRNFPSYPPPGTPPPSLSVPTVQVMLMVLSCIPMWLADRAARELDLSALRGWSVVVCVLAVVFCVLRVRGLELLNVRWDDNAYGSAVWFTIGFHTLILVFEAIETIIFTAFLFRPSVEDSMYPAASDNAAYWYFMTLVWVPLYLMLFLSPRLAGW